MSEFNNRSHSVTSKHQEGRGSQVVRSQHCAGTVLAKSI